MRLRFDLLRRPSSFASDRPLRLTARGPVRAGRSLLAGALALAATGAPVLKARAQQYAPPYPQYGQPYGSPYGQQNGYGQPPSSLPYQPQYQPQGYAPPPAGYGQSPYAQSYPQQTLEPGYGPQSGTGTPAEPLNPETLAQLVAPIALYPDAVVAEILAASTYPAQVAAADQWLASMGSAAPDQIAAGADAQTSWDPSVKALTAFPQVMTMLARNLEWTTALGNAYYNQPQDVLGTIQAMRQRAQDAGNLVSTPQEVVASNPGYISIAPASMETVWLPQYNPWTVYGAPVAPFPGFSLIGALGAFFGSGGLHYGLSFAMTAFMHTPWGLLGWGLDWLTHAILFNHGSYLTRSASVRDWGLPHGGPRAYPGAWGRGGYAWSRAGYGYRSEEPVRIHGPAPARALPAPARWADARSSEGFNRGFPQRGLPERGYGDRVQPYGRPALSYQGRPEYGGGRPAQPATGLRSPSESYRAPGFDRRPSGGAGYTGSGWRGGETASGHAGGLHPFGGGHATEGFGSRAPKGYGAGGWRAPREGHPGGGHSFGGGHFGGHSGGGRGGHHH